MSEQAFLELMMQDFSKYGVVDQGDKHRLYKAIKNARQSVGIGEDSQDSAGYSNFELQGHSGTDLLDLDAHDGDLIEVCALTAAVGQPDCCRVSGFTTSESECRAPCNHSRCRLSVMPEQQQHSSS